MAPIKRLDEVRSAEAGDLGDAAANLGELHAGALRVADPLVVVDALRCSSCGHRNLPPTARAGPPRCVMCRDLLPWLTVARDDDFEAAILTPARVIVYFWNPSCASSRGIAAEVELVARELAGRLKVVTVNVVEGPYASARLAVASVPTILMLRDGQVVARHTGVSTVDRLVDWVRTSFEVDRGPSRD